MGFSGHDAAALTCQAPWHLGVGTVIAVLSPAAPPACPAGMATIPGGTFRMGSPEGEGDSDERPMHLVTLSPFCLDLTEVTVVAYGRCVSAGACTAPATSVAKPGERDDPWCNWGRGRDDHPVNCVDWTQADTFCRWADKALPTEAQWEFAARRPQGRRFPWSGREPVARLLRWDSEDGTTPVGRYPAGRTPEGVLDLAGNVAEWVADGFAPYAAAVVCDPPPAAKTLLRPGDVQS